MSELNTMKSIPRSARMCELDLLRFVLSVLMVYYHIAGVWINLFPDNALYQTLLSYNGSVGTYSVLTFFIISGVFFCKEHCPRGGGRSDTAEEIYSTLACNGVFFAD